MTSGYPLHAEDIARIRQMGEQGFTVREIYIRTGFADPTIRRALNNAPRSVSGHHHRNTRLPDDVRRAIRELHREGLYSHSELAKMHGCSQSTIVTILGEVHQPYQRTAYNPKPLEDVYAGSIPFPTKERLMAGR